MQTPNHPFTNTRFRIEIEGMAGTGAVEVVFPEARIVAPPRGPRKTQYTALTLRRGLTRSSEWYDWWDSARRPARSRGRAVLVVLLDASGAGAIRWTYTNAIPIAYLVSHLHALGAEPLIESLDLGVEGFAADFSATPARRRKA